jgi:toxin ParE1/3/4
LLAALKPLETFPLSGSMRPTLAVGLRVVFHAHHALYYQVAESEVVVIRVLHGARDSSAIAADGGFRG